ncbi:DUF7520 family protein [Halostella litorea]|uniref:DUF7520 family protein n=1 Tax=Halostella litorea TaxID=2528831 RepID=UPI001091C27E|nr:cox cluster protein [Halostella litorea]
MSTITDASVGGKRMVLGIYAAIVALAAVFGAMVGLVLPAKENAPETAGFGPFVFEINPLNFAVYGAVNIAVVLGVLLLLMWAVSNRYPDA